MDYFHITLNEQTLEDIEPLFSHETKIKLSDDAVKRIVRCREYLESKMEETDSPIYGIQQALALFVIYQS
jgi:histidine ammonia-lyase